MKNKLKGWKSEQKIDSWLKKVYKKEIKCSKQGEYLLCESKTYIQALKKELANYIISNELLNKENNRLGQSEIEAQEIIAELESKLSEFKRFGLDKELEKLKQMEGFGNEIK